MPPVGTRAWLDSLMTMPAVEYLAPVAVERERVARPLVPHLAVHGSVAWLPKTEAPRQLSGAAKGPVGLLGLCLKLRRFVLGIKKGVNGKVGHGDHDDLPTALVGDRVHTYASVYLADRRHLAARLAAGRVRHHPSAVVGLRCGRRGLLDRPPNFRPIPRAARAPSRHVTTVRLPT